METRLIVGVWVASVRGWARRKDGFTVIVLCIMCLKVLK